MPPRDDALLDHAEFLRSIARGLLGDPDRAADVVQDTWVAVLERPPRHAKSLRGWLAVVARNFARRTERADRRRVAREQRAATPEGLPSAEEVAARLELQRKVVEAIEALEEPYRSTLLLRYFDGLDPKEIARRAGLPVGTVKTRLSRALEKVRARLGERRTWAPLLLPLVFRDTVAAAPTGAIATGVLLTMKKAIAILVLLVGGLVVLLHQSRDRAEPVRAASNAAREPAGTAAAEQVVEENAPPAGEGRPESAGPFIFDGRVVDVGGVGVRGARVRLVYAHSGDRSDPMGRIRDRIRREAERHEGPEILTDADGYFRFARPYPSGSYLVASAEGYAETISGEHAPNKPVTITLLAASGTLVRVVDPEGVRVAGARVRLVALGAAQEVRGMALPREVLHRTETDERGEAPLPAFSGARLRIEVDPRESDLGLVSSPVTGKETIVSLPRVKVLDCRIVDAETGAPVPGAYVIVGEDTSYWSWSAELERRRFYADADGRVRIPYQGAEKLVAFHASAPDYEQAFGVGDPIRLRRSMHMRGVVVDRAGAALAGVPVVVTSRHGWESVCHALPLVSAWTDAEGRFEFELKLLKPRDVVPDLGVRSIIAIHDGLAAVRDGIAVEPGRTLDLRLEMPEPATLEVELADTEGNPLVNKRIFVTREIPRAPSWPEVGRAPLLDMLGRDVPTTDAAGLAAIDRLPPGVYQVSYDTLDAEATLGEGERKRVRLVQGAGLRITGVLLDADGRPLAGKHVGLSGRDASGRTTDAQGRFVFVDLKPGEYDVHYDMQFGSEFARLRVPARPGDDVVIRVPAAPARLEVTVEGPPPESVRYAFATKSGSYVPRDGGELCRLGAPSSEFLPGEGLLVARAEGFGWAAVRFEAMAGQTTPVHVALQRAGTVRARLANSPESRRVFVRLTRDDGSLESIMADSTFRYAIHRAGTPIYQEPLGEEIADVAPGTYRATAGCYAGDGADSWTEIAAARVEVVTGKSAGVEMTPPR